MPVITVSSKGQIIIPSEIRKKFNIKQGDRFQLHEHEGKLVLVPLQDRPFVKLHGTLKGKTSLTGSLRKEHALEIEKEER
ncbi:AbrB/MazE/SpoVT family DNA-binding domain-containing protein [Pelotomaculum isophthalicicum JI]|uniref:AbrB/MazE/SpoVT family DNA-binding domain-containing protein n=1 Tax=Pelotomaculum isophthalicicum JI TaxID=947010 RepID=A0A9X4JTU6_9FIRM|nr:AbrB/MazE/SpoVT family DNA-binding domain-containing protein [Pelotomaculum isophthalicicum]MDF9407975.1 AbrB/MazE/SpoVT family DNA-binding domain-containing protein [Pelotomaculum isophthalicicum JI]